MYDRPTSHPPRRAFRWTAYVLAVTAFGAAIPTPLYPIYSLRFHFTSGVLGLVFACYSFGVLLTIFLVAPQAERVGRKKLLYFGMVFTALAMVVFTFATGVAWLALGRAVTGVGVGLTTSVATAAMTDLEPYRDKHHVARVAVAANFGGFAVGALLSGIFLQYGPDPVQLVYLLPVIATALGFWAVSTTPETATSIGTQRGPLVQRVSVPANIRTPFWVGAGGLAACYSMYGFFAALVPSYLRSGLGVLSPAAEGGIVALMFGMAAISQLATSEIRDRRALLVGFPLLLVAVAALVIILSLSTPVPLLLVAPVMGVAVGLTFMGSITLVDRVAPEGQRGEILAGYYSAGYLALAIPTIGVAEASDQIGLSAAGGLFGILLALAVAILYVGIARTPTPSGGGGRPRDSPASPR
ncbi:MAG: MFS transporter [Thermoplasmata archaeon]